MYVLQNAGHFFDLGNGLVRHRAPAATGLQESLGCFKAVEATTHTPTRAVEKDSLQAKSTNLVQFYRVLSLQGMCFNIFHQLSTFCASQSLTSLLAHHPLTQQAGGRVLGEALSVKALSFNTVGQCFKALFSFHCRAGSSQGLHALKCLLTTRFIFFQDFLSQLFHAKWSCLLCQKQLPD